MNVEDFDESCWIFGYGSIIWKSSFPYCDKIYGYVEGYARRFWQGSHDHRGTPEKPGRVVTLIPSLEETTWGVAYHIDQSNWQSVINNLNSREIDGYSPVLATFKTSSNDGETFKIWIYIAPQGNQSFLGEAPLDTIAQQIVESEGISGSNLEYLLNLAQALREIGPFALDHHTSQLERYIIEKLINPDSVKVK